MKAYDTINKQELDVTLQELVELMSKGNRQVDLVLGAPVTDSDGYLTWDIEHWSSFDARRFIRTYELKGRTLNEYTTHNIYDLQNDFHPEQAQKVQIS